MTLKHHVAIITGGADGIGQATAALLVELGAQVVVADRLEEAGRAWAQSHDRARFVHTDMTEETAVAALIESVIGEFGQIDLLFNNAGGSERDGGLISFDRESLDNAVHQNLLAAGLGIKYAAPHMVRRKCGCIVNTASVAAIHPAMGSIVYSSAKAALLQLTRAVAARVARHNVRVNCVLPGIIPTGFLARTYGLDAQSARRAQRRLQRAAPGLQPLPIGGEPLDIARAVVFLAGEGGRFITGQSLVIDGGLTIGQGPDLSGDAFSPLTELLDLPGPNDQV